VRPGLLRAVGSEWDLSWRITGNSAIAEGLTVEAVATVDETCQVVVTLGFRDGQVRVLAMTFVPTTDADTTAALGRLRQFRLGDLQKEITDSLNGGVLRAFLPTEWLETMVTPPRPGRAGHPVRHYAELVERYLAACEDHPDAPVKWLHETSGDSHAVLSSSLYKAEQLGLIEDRPGQGKSGGTMTTKCRRILAGEEE